MNATILVKIITPLSIALEKQAKMVTMSGEEGMFGVLPSHVPMIVSLKAGLVQVYIDDMHKSENTYLISSGVTEVTANYINIATETAINVTNFSEAEIATKLLDLQKTLSDQHYLFEKSTFWDKVILMSLQGFFPSLRGARSDAAILSNFLRLPCSSTAARNDDVYST